MKRHCLQSPCCRDSVLLQAALVVALLGCQAGVASPSSDAPDAGPQSRPDAHTSSMQDGSTGSNLLFADVGEGGWAVIDTCTNEYVIPIGPDHDSQNIPMNLLDMSADFDLSCGEGQGADAAFVLDPPEPVWVEITVHQVTTPFPLHVEVVEGECAEPGQGTSLTCFEHASNTPWPHRLFLDGPSTLYLKADSADELAPVMVTLRALVGDDDSVFQMAAEQVRALDFGSDGNRDLLAVGTSQATTLVEHTNGSWSVVAEWNGMPARTVALNPRGTELATAMITGRLGQIFSVDPDEPLRNIYTIEEGNNFGLVWDRAGRFLFALGKSAGPASIRKIDTLPQEPTHEDFIVGDFAQNAGLLAYSEDRLTIGNMSTIWHMDPDGTVIRNLTAEKVLRGVSSDGSVFVGTDPPHLLDESGIAGVPLARADGLFINAVAISRDHSRVALAGDAGHVVVSDASSGAKVWERQTGFSPITALAWSNDGALLAVGDATDVSVWAVPAAP